MLFLHKTPQILYAFLFYFRMNHNSMQNEIQFFFCSRQKLYSIFGFGSCPGAIMKYTVRIWNIVETCPQQRVWWWASTWIQFQSMRYFSCYIVAKWNAWFESMYAEEVDVCLFWFWLSFGSSFSIKKVHVTVLAIMYVWWWVFYWLQVESWHCGLVLKVHLEKC